MKKLYLLFLIVVVLVTTSAFSQGKVEGYCATGQSCHWEMENGSEAYVLCHPPASLVFESYGQSSGRLVCK